MISSYHTRHIAKFLSVGSQYQNNVCTLSVQMRHTLLYLTIFGKPTSGKNGYLLHQVKMLPFKFEAKKTLCVRVTCASSFFIFVSAFMPDRLVPSIWNNFDFLAYRLFLPTQKVCFVSSLG